MGVSPACLNFQNQICKMAMRSKRDVDILTLGERQQFLNWLLAGYPELFAAAVIGTERMRPCIIDSDKAGLHASRRILLWKH